MLDKTILHWGTASSLFQLNVDSEPAHSAAREVLAPWLIPLDQRVSARPTEPDQSWHVSTTSAPTPTVAGPDGISPEATLEDAILTVEYQAAASQFYRSSPGKAVHAALLSLPTGIGSNDGSVGRIGVLLVGPSRSGKSTLACALWQRGWQLHADDVALLHPDSLSAWPTARRVSVRRTSKNILGKALWEKLNASPSCMKSPEGLLCHPLKMDDTYRLTTKNEPATIAAIFFLQRRLRSPQNKSEERLGFSALSPAEGLLAFVPYTNAEPQQTGLALQALAPLLNAVPAYDLYTQDPHRMAEVVEQEATALKAALR